MLSADIELHIGSDKVVESCWEVLGSRELLGSTVTPLSRGGILLSRTTSEEESAGDKSFYQCSIPLTISLI